MVWLRCRVPAVVTIERLTPQSDYRYTDKNHQYTDEIERSRTTSQSQPARPVGGSVALTSLEIRE